MTIKIQSGRLLILLLLVTVLMPACQAESQFKVKQVACSAYRDAVLLDNGTVWAWGTNVVGHTGGLLPHMVPGPGNITMIAADSLVVYMLKDDGTVWGYGFSSDSRPDGVRGEPSEAIMIPGLSKVISISAKDQNLMALTVAGEVWALGDNCYGELGNAMNYSSLSPVVNPVKVDISGVELISSGGIFSWAVKDDGTIWAWGNNYYGQLGDGTVNWTGPKGRCTPVKSNYFSDVAEVACGKSYTAVLRKDGTVWIWGGDNANGQRGDGSGMKLSELNQYPVQVKISDVKAIASGYYNLMALKDDGTVWTWGDNSEGQLGDGSLENRNLPVQVSGLSQVVAISACERSCTALDEQGRVWAWGDGKTGQLGDGVTGYDYNSTTPVQILWNLNETMIRVRNSTPMQDMSTTGQVSAMPAPIQPESPAASPGYNGITPLICLLIGVGLSLFKKEKST